MSELLPCPLCGHLREKPGHNSKFKCKGCEQWLELPKGQSSFQDYSARIAADKVRIDQHWRKLAEEKAKKEGIDFDTAYQMVIEARDKNILKMRKPVSVKVSFPPVEDEPNPAPESQPFTNDTKPIVAMSKSLADDPEAPF